MAKLTIAELKEVLKNGTKKPKTRFHQEWKEINGKRYFFRSRWEANYACYLEWRKNSGFIKDWLHEPKTFWFMEIKRGVRSYLPDFQVFKTTGDHYWVEVKGFYDARSLTKIKRFKKYYPDETLNLVDKEWFKAFKGESIVPGWQ